MNVRQNIIKRVKRRFSEKKNNFWNFYNYLHDDNFRLEEMLGLSFDDYTSYIINTFNDEINDVKGFHIDHIKPLNRSINEQEYIKLWHYTNTKAESPSKNTDKRDSFDYEY